MLIVGLNMLYNIKNIGDKKICVCQKDGVTLHSLSGNNGSEDRKHKDIENTYNRQEVVQENAERVRMQKSIQSRFLVNSEEAKQLRPEPREIGRTNTKQ